MLLRPCVKNYPWGKVGSNSLVWELYSGLHCDADAMSSEESQKQPYAELWMGAHPSGPSMLVSNEPHVPLHEYIAKNPNVLGKNILTTFGTNLPFLLKVLSVQQALSIQAHPNKNLAAVLHSRDPKNYPDANHKPEMAVALTSFEVLCGFRHLDEINEFIRQIPEFRDLIGDGLLNTKEDLRQAYKQLMSSDHDKIKLKISDLLARSNNPGNEVIPEIDLIQRLNSQFPADIGIWSVYFLQHFTLKPGEALFLPANEPHAYLYGDCVECMANSDNVVRAGLTPKFKDVNVLTDMLTFESGKDWLFRGIPSGGGRTTFYPPIPDFAIERIETADDFTLVSPDSCSVMLVLAGNAKLGQTTLVKGVVAFLAADFTGTVECNNSSVCLYRAFCPSPRPQS